MSNNLSWNRHIDTTAKKATPISHLVINRSNIQDINYNVTVRDKFLLFLVQQQLMGQMFIFIKKNLKQKHTKFFTHVQTVI